MRERFTASQLWYRALYSIRCRLGFNTKLTRWQWIEEQIKDAKLEDAAIEKRQIEDAADLVLRTHPEAAAYVADRLAWATSRLVAGLRKAGFRPTPGMVSSLKQAIRHSKGKKEVCCK
ncbi:MAG: hypothetical protein WBZ01_21455 [Terriglobales bacterium]|jgi:hypothetical protein